MKKIIYTLLLISVICSMFYIPLDITINAEDTISNEITNESTLEKTEDSTQSIDAEQLSNETEESTNIESSIITIEGDMEVLHRDVDAEEEPKTNDENPKSTRSVPATGFVDTSSISSSTTITVYTSSTLSTAYTYYNPGSSNVITYFGSTSNALEVNVNGYTGWIAKSSSFKYLTVTEAMSKNYVTYFSKNTSGDLLMTYRYYGSGVTIVVGQAPSFLSIGTKYYSTDGIYFYTTVTKMINDLKSGLYTSGVNTVPYYNYYQYLPFKSSTNLTKTDFKNYITSKGYSSASSILARDEVIGAFFTGQENMSVNAALEFSMAVLESGYGTSFIAMNKNNLFGWGAYDSNPYGGAYKFSSPKEGVLYHMENAIDDGYLDNLTDSRYFGSSVGNKLTGVNVKYASDPYWGLKIAGIYYSIDKSSGYKDLNYYTLGMVNKTNTNIGMYYNGTNVYNFKNNASNLNPSYQPVLLLSNNSGRYEAISDTSIYNSGDNTQSVAIKNDVVTRVSYGNPSVNTAAANADTTFSKDIVSFTHNNVKVFGGSNYNKPVNSSNSSNSSFVGYTKTNLQKKAVIYTTSNKNVYSTKPHSSNKVAEIKKGTEVIVTGYYYNSSSIFYEVVYGENNARGYIFPDGFYLISGNYGEVINDTSLYSTSAGTNIRRTTLKGEIFSLKMPITGGTLNNNQVWYEVSSNITGTNDIGYLSSSSINITSSTTSLYRASSKVASTSDYKKTNLKNYAVVEVQSTKGVYTDTSTYKKLYNVKQGDKLLVSGYFYNSTVAWYEVLNPLTGIKGYVHFNNLKLVTGNYTKDDAKVYDTSNVLVGTSKNLVLMNNDVVNDTYLLRNIKINDNVASYSSTTYLHMLGGITTTPETPEVPNNFDGYKKTSLQKKGIIRTTEVKDIYTGKPSSNNKFGTIPQNTEVIVTGYYYNNDNIYYEVIYGDNNEKGYIESGSFYLVAGYYGEVNKASSLYTSSTGTVVRRTAIVGEVYSLSMPVTGRTYANNQVWYKVNASIGKTNDIGYVSSSDVNISSSATSLYRAKSKIVSKSNYKKTNLQAFAVVEVQSTKGVYTDISTYESLYTVQKGDQLLVSGYYYNNNVAWYEVVNPLTGIKGYVHYNNLKLVSGTYTKDDVNIYDSTNVLVGRSSNLIVSNNEIINDKYFLREVKINESVTLYNSAIYLHMIGK